MSWRERGLCWQSEPSYFFPTVGQTAHAKKICAACPVKAECLEYALVAFPSRHHDFGVWGGTSPRERERLRWERPDSDVRTCKRCFTEKPLDAFPRSGSGYRRYDCRECWARVKSPRRGPTVKVHTKDLEDI